MPGPLDRFLVRRPRDPQQQQPHKRRKQVDEGGEPAEGCSRGTCPGGPAAVLGVLDCGPLAARLCAPPAPGCQPWRSQMLGCSASRRPEAVLHGLSKQHETAAWQMPGPAISLLPLPAAPSHVLHMGLTEGITLLSWPALADAAQRSAPRTSPARGAAVAATAAAGQPPVHALLPAPPGRRVQLTWGSQRDITTAAAASPVTAHELVVHTDRHGLVLLELGAGARAVRQLAPSRTHAAAISGTVTRDVQYIQPHVVAAAYTNCVLAWDVRTPGPSCALMQVPAQTGMSQYYAPPAKLTSLQASGDATVLLGGCDSGKVLMWDVRRMNSGAASSALSFGAQGPYAHALLRTFDLPTLVSSCDMEAAGPGSSHGGRGASTLSLLQLVGGWALRVRQLLRDPSGRQRVAFVADGGMAGVLCLRSGSVTHFVNAAEEWLAACPPELGMARPTCSTGLQHCWADGAGDVLLMSMAQFPRKRDDPDDDGDVGPCPPARVIAGVDLSVRGAGSGGRVRLCHTKRFAGTLCRHPESGDMLMTDVENAQLALLQ